VLCRARVPLPEGRGLTSHIYRHPEDEVDVLDWLQLDGGIFVLEVRVRGPTEESWERELKSNPIVERVEWLNHSEEGVHLLLTVKRMEFGFMPLFQKHRVMRRRPYSIRHGIASWVLIGPESRIRALLRELMVRVPLARVESIRPLKAPPRGLPLTRRQEELFRKAIEEGYFAVPSRISLTELARRLGISKSTLSTSLATAELRLLDLIRSEPGPRS
jgi:predicted DNA binding protein